MIVTIVEVLGQIASVMTAVVAIYLAVYGNKDFRILKDIETHRFKKDVLKFLEDTLFAWGASTTMPSTSLTVSENIRAFNQLLLTKKPYLSYFECKKFTNIIYEARKLSELWEKGLFVNAKEIEKKQRNLYQKYKKLAEEIDDPINSILKEHWENDMNEI